MCVCSLTSQRLSFFLVLSSMGSINLFYPNCIPGTYQIVQPMVDAQLSICWVNEWENCQNKFHTDPLFIFFSLEPLWSGEDEQAFRWVTKVPFAHLKEYSFLFFSISESESCSVLLDSLWPHSPWNSPGQNNGVGSLSLLQGIFPTQGSNSGLPHCRKIIYQLNHQGNLRILEWVAYPFSNGSSWPRNRTGISCVAGGFFTNWAIREALSIYTSNKL